MKKNVVIYVGSFEMPDRNAAAQRVMANALILKFLGYNVVFAGRNSEFKLGRNEFKKAKYQNSDFDFWEIGCSRNNVDWFLHLTSVSALRKLIEKYYKGRVYAIVCYNYPSLAQWRVNCLAHNFGALAMADVTEWYQPVRLTSLGAIIKNIDTLLRMRFVNQRMDGLVTTSAYLTRYYKKRFKDVIELPTLIDHNPSDLSALEATPDGQPKRLFYGGSVALDRKYGVLKDRIDWVIEILDAVKLAGGKFKLDIYGINKDEYINYSPVSYESLNRLGDSIEFHGIRPRSVLLDALRSADFSIFMRLPMRSTLAGFPTKFSESISFGTPVITNPLENIYPFMISGENCEFIEYNEFDKSVSKILSILMIPQSDIMRRKILCRSSATFHPMSFVSEVIKIFPMQI